MYYHKLGKLPAKRHTTFKKEDGSLYREHLMGLEGFSGISSLLYKEHYPSATLRMEELLSPEKSSQSADHKLDYWHFRTAKLKHFDNMIHSRRPLMGNDQCEISVSTCTVTEAFRNASHHELYYIDEGRGMLRSEFGLLSFVPGDYISIPKGITYQFEFEAEAKYLLTQSLSPICFPRRYLNKMGQFLEHSPVCERDIKVPTELDPQIQPGEVPVTIHRNGRYFRQVMEKSPFDTVGWDGYLYPYAISIHDFEPIVGRLHMPPPIHQMFESAHFVVCNFVPRLYDFHPDAIPAPYYHSNIDSDEVIYYCEGNFMSRSGIEKGSITLHPAGTVHGPQPGKIEASVGKKETNELAVMIDTFAPLKVYSCAREIQVLDYNESWIEKK